MLNSGADILKIIDEFRTENEKLNCKVVVKNLNDYLANHADYRRRLKRCTTKKLSQILLERKQRLIKRHQKNITQNSITKKPGKPTSRTNMNDAETKISNKPIFETATSPLPVAVSEKMKNHSKAPFFDPFDTTLAPPDIITRNLPTFESRKSGERIASSTPTFQKSISSSSHSVNRKPSDDSFTENRGQTLEETADLSAISNSTKNMSNGKIFEQAPVKKTDKAKNPNIFEVMKDMLKGDQSNYSENRPNLENSKKQNWNSSEPQKDSPQFLLNFNENKSSHVSTLNPELYFFTVPHVRNDSSKTQSTDVFAVLLELRTNRSKLFSDSNPVSTKPNKLLSSEQDGSILNHYEDSQFRTPATEIRFRNETSRSDESASLPKISQSPSENFNTTRVGDQKSVLTFASVNTSLQNLTSGKAVNDFILTDADSNENVLQDIKTTPILPQNPSTVTISSQTATPNNFLYKFGESTSLSTKISESTIEDFNTTWIKDQKSMVTTDSVNTPLQNLKLHNTIIDSTLAGADSDENVLSDKKTTTVLSTNLSAALLSNQTITPVISFDKSDGSASLPTEKSGSAFEDFNFSRIEDQKSTLTTNSLRTPLQNPILHSAIVDSTLASADSNENILPHILPTDLSATSSSSQTITPVIGNIPNNSIYNSDNSAPPFPTKIPEWTFEELNFTRDEDQPLTSTTASVNTPLQNLISRSAISDAVLAGAESDGNGLQEIKTMSVSPSKPYATTISVSRQSATLATNYIPNNLLRKFDESASVPLEKQQSTFRDSNPVLLEDHEYPTIANTANKSSKNSPLITGTSDIKQIDLLTLNPEEEVFQRGAISPSSIFASTPSFLGQMSTSINKDPPSSSTSEFDKSASHVLQKSESTTDSLIHSFIENKESATASVMNSPFQNPPKGNSTSGIICPVVDTGSEIRERTTMLSASLPSADIFPALVPLLNRIYNSTQKGIFSSATLQYEKPLSPLLEMSKSTTESFTSEFIDSNISTTNSRVNSLFQNLARENASNNTVFPIADTEREIQEVTTMPSVSSADISPPLISLLNRISSSTQEGIFSGITFPNEKPVSLSSKRSDSTAEAFIPEFVDSNKATTSRVNSLFQNVARGNASDSAIFPTANTEQEIQELTTMLSAALSSVPVSPSSVPLLNRISNSTQEGIFSRTTFQYEKPALQMSKSITESLISEFVENSESRTISTMDSLFQGQPSGNVINGTTFAVEDPEDSANHEVTTMSATSISSANISPPLVTLFNPISNPTQEIIFNRTASKSDKLASPSFERSKSTTVLFIPAAVDNSDSTIRSPLNSPFPSQPSLSDDSGTIYAVADSTGNIIKETTTTHVATSSFSPGTSPSSSALLVGPVSSSPEEKFSTSIFEFNESASLPLATSEPPTESSISARIIDSASELASTDDSSFQSPQSENSINGTLTKVGLGKDVIRETKTLVADFASMVHSSFGHLSTLVTENVSNDKIFRSRESRPAYEDFSSTQAEDRESTISIPMVPIITTIGAAPKTNTDLEDNQKSTITISSATFQNHLSTSATQDASSDATFGDSTCLACTIDDRSAAETADNEVDTNAASESDWSATLSLNGTESVIAVYSPSLQSIPEIRNETVSNSGSSTPMFLYSLSEKMNTLSAVRSDPDMIGTQSDFAIGAKSGASNQLASTEQPLTPRFMNGNEERRTTTGNLNIDKLSGHDTDPFFKLSPSAFETVTQNQTTEKSTIHRSDHFVDTSSGFPRKTQNRISDQSHPVTVAQTDKSMYNGQQQERITVVPATHENENCDFKSTNDGWFSYSKSRLNFLEEISLIKTADSARNNETDGTILLGSPDSESGVNKPPEIANSFMVSKPSIEENFKKDANITTFTSSYPSATLNIADSGTPDTKSVFAIAVNDNRTIHYQNSDVESNRVTSNTEHNISGNRFQKLSTVPVVISFAEHRITDGTSELNTLGVFTSTTTEDAEVHPSSSPVNTKIPNISEIKSQKTSNSTKNGLPKDPEKYYSRVFANPTSSKQEQLILSNNDSRNESLMGNQFTTSKLHNQYITVPPPLFYNVKKNSTGQKKQPRLPPLNPNDNWKMVENDEYYPFNDVIRHLFTTPVFKTQTTDRRTENVTDYGKLDTFVEYFDDDNQSFSSESQNFDTSSDTKENQTAYIKSNIPTMKNMASQKAESVTDLIEKSDEEVQNNILQNSIFNKSQSIPQSKDTQSTNTFLYSEYVNPVNIKMDVNQSQSVVNASRMIFGSTGNFKNVLNVSSIDKSTEFLKLLLSNIVDQNGVSHQSKTDVGNKSLTESCNNIFVIGNDSLQVLKDIFESLKPEVPPDQNVPDFTHSVEIPQRAKDSGTSADFEDFVRSKMLSRQNSRTSAHSNEELQLSNKHGVSTFSVENFRSSQSEDEEGIPVDPTEEFLRSLFPFVDSRTLGSFAKVYKRYDRKAPTGRSQFKSRSRLLDEEMDEDPGKRLKKRSNSISKKPKQPTNDFFVNTLREIFRLRNGIPKALISHSKINSH